MADTSTLGAMLQGVSQQPAHLRRDGQVEEQVNLLSHAIRGITSRPGSKLLGTNSALPLDLSFKKFKVNGEVFRLGWNTSTAVVIDSLGQTRPTTLSQEALDYLGQDMRVYVYDNKETEAIYLLNRDKVVAMETDTAAQEALVVRDVALVTSLGGLFSHTYSVDVETADGIVISGTYVAPDGLSDGDAAKTTSDYIANQLAISLNSAGNKPAGMNVVSAGSVIKISGVPDVRVATEDGAGGDTLVYQTNVAKSTEELANFAPHGTLVQVIGLDGSEDDFYMRFEVSEEDTIGNGFGSEGLWREWYNPSEPTALDNTTMPMLITKQEDGSFDIGVASWYSRRVGDAETNPAPGFVGKAIRDINGFQSRLVFVAGPLTNMSVTNEPSDFFKQSAVAELPTDPIEMLSTAEDEFSLQFIVPFDRDLVIFGDDNQFHISGAEGLTYANASMVQTTEFEMSGTAKPKSTGKTVLFPFSLGSFSGIKEFFSSNTVDANSAATITETVPKYIKGNVDGIQVSTNFEIALFTTDDAETSNEIYAYKYLWNGEEKIQSSWSKWVFVGEVSDIYIDDNQVYVLLLVDGTYTQTVIDLDLPDTGELGYSLILDEYKEYSTETTTYTAPSGQALTQVLLPKGNMKVVVSSGTDIGKEINPTEVTASGSGYLYRFSEDVLPLSESVYAGIPVPQSFKPTMPFIRDRNNLAIRFIKLVVSKFLIHFEDSGPITATKSSRYRSVDTTLTNKYVPEFQDPDNLRGISLTSGYFDFPFGDRTDTAKLTISSDGPLPISINEIEWVGQTRGGKRRV